MLAVVISILGGVLNVKLPGRISTTGTSSSSSRSSELARPRTTTRSHGYSARSEPTLTRNVLAGKRLDTYIFPSADFWASHVYYLDTYTVNLEFDDNFPVFYDLIYIYIYIYFLPFMVILYLGNIPKGYFIYFGLFFLKFGYFSNKNS